MNTNAPEVKEIIRRAFPAYNGRRIKVEPFRGPMKLTSYWSGGSRDYWAVVPILPTTPKAFFVPENGTPFTQDLADLQALPEGFALVRHTAGHFETACVYVNENNMTPLLPAPVELTDDEKIVVRFTASLKSSYGGVSNYRFVSAQRATGIDIARWDTAKTALIGKGLLNKAGAMTDAGRNADSALRGF